MKPQLLPRLEHADHDVGLPAEAELAARRARPHDDRAHAGAFEVHAAACAPALDARLRRRVAGLKRPRLRRRSSTRRRPGRRGGARASTAARGGRPASARADWSRARVSMSATASFVEQAGDADPGVVDDHVDRPERRFGGGEERVDRVGVGDVEVMRERAATRRLDAAARRRASRSVRRAPSATDQPSAPKRRAIAAPMPDEAPVTSARPLRALTAHAARAPWVKLDRQRREAAHVHRVDARDAAGVDLVVRAGAPDLLERDAALEPRQRRAEAEVRAVAERRASRWCRAGCRSGRGRGTRARRDWPSRPAARRDRRRACVWPCSSTSVATVRASACVEPS